MQIIKKIFSLTLLIQLATNNACALDMNFLQNIVNISSGSALGSIFSNFELKHFIYYSAPAIASTWTIMQIRHLRQKNHFLRNITTQKNNFESSAATQRDNSAMREAHLQTELRQTHQSLYQTRQENIFARQCLLQALSLIPKPTNQRQRNTRARNNVANKPENQNISNQQVNHQNNPIPRPSGPVGLALLSSLVHPKPQT